MSVNPSDWTFDVARNEGEKNELLLYLNCDKLGKDEIRAEDLPKEIVDLLLPLGVDTNCEAMESIFEVKTSLSPKKFIKKLQELNFVYDSHSGFSED